jgi:hypothetical protein
MVPRPSITMNSPMPAIYFLHIPKTAGTSIHDMLVKNFGEKVSPFRLWDHLRNVNTAVLDQYEIFSGHFGIAFLKLLSRPTTVFTFLRNPIDRTLSHFMHVKRDPGHPYYRYASGMALSEFLNDPITMPLIYNVQSRYLAFELTGLDCLRRISPDYLDRGNLSVAWENMSFGMSDSDIRTQALAALDRLHFVGFVERFDRSMESLTKFLHAPECHLSKANVSPNMDAIGEVTEATRKQILNLTQIDMELFELAKAKHSAGAVPGSELMV